ncbi:MAG: helix-turn-helix transcriptional regulator [Firmicutes bacterium]|nr:helix-turn-helix transcriptional regulator [Bacillota bacterium]
MENYAITVGKRLRAYRLQRGLTQERVAELAELHPTYIGQAERGEKNMTLQSLVRILAALEVSAAEFFAADSDAPGYRSPAARCHDLLLRRTPEQQEQLYHVLHEADKLIKQ